MIKLIERLFAKEQTNKKNNGDACKNAEYETEFRKVSFWCNNLKAIIDVAEKKIKEEQNKCHQC